MECRQRSSPPRELTEKKGTKASLVRSLAASPLSKVSAGDQPDERKIRTGRPPAKEKSERHKPLVPSSSVLAPSNAIKAAGKKTAPLTHRRPPTQVPDPRTSAPSVQRHGRHDTVPRPAPLQSTALTAQSALGHQTPTVPDMVPSDSHTAVPEAALQTLKKPSTAPTDHRSLVPNKAPIGELASPASSVWHSPILVLDDEDQASKHSSVDKPCTTPSVILTKAQRKSVPRRVSPSPSPMVFPGIVSIPSTVPFSVRTSLSPQPAFSAPALEASLYLCVQAPLPQYVMPTSRSHSPTRSPLRSYRSRYSSAHSSRRPSPDCSYSHGGRDYFFQHYTRSRFLAVAMVLWLDASPQWIHSNRQPHCPRFRWLLLLLLFRCPNQRRVRFRTRMPLRAQYLQLTFCHPPRMRPYFNGTLHPPDDSREFQDLFKRVAQTQNVQLADVQTKEYKLLKNLHPRQQSRAALPIDEAILEPASEIWHTPASAPPTSKQAEKRDFIPSKGLEFLFTHPQPNSLVVDAALNRAKNSQVKNAAAEKEAKKLDIFCRKVYSSSTLLHIANYAALLSNHGFDNITKLAGLAQNTSEADKAILCAVVQERYACSRASLQIAIDVVDTATRSIATAISMHRASWLAAAGVPRGLQAKVKDLPFDKLKLFADKTDEVLHTGKDSRTTLRTLGMYVPPFRCQRYFPNQRRYDFQFQRRQPRLFDQTRSKQRAQHRCPQPSRATNVPHTKQQV